MILVRMSDLDLKDIELKEHDPYHDYMEQKARDAEFESVSLMDEVAEERKNDTSFELDELIYHIMWPVYFLSNGHEWH